MYLVPLDDPGGEKRQTITIPASRTITFGRGSFGIDALEITPFRAVAIKTVNTASTKFAHVENVGKGVITIVSSEADRNRPLQPGSSGDLYPGDKLQLVETGSDPYIYVLDMTSPRAKRKRSSQTSPDIAQKRSTTAKKRGTSSSPIEIGDEEGTAEDVNQKPIRDLTVHEVANWILKTSAQSGQGEFAFQIVKQCVSQDIDGRALLAVAQSSSFEDDFAALCTSLEAGSTSTTGSRASLSFGFKVKLKKALKDMQHCRSSEGGSSNPGASHPVQPKEEAAASRSAGGMSASNRQSSDCEIMQVDGSSSSSFANEGTMPYVPNEGTVEYGPNEKTMPYVAPAVLPEVQSSGSKKTSKPAAPQVNNQAALMLDASKDIDIASSSSPTAKSQGINGVEGMAARGDAKVVDHRSTSGTPAGSSTPLKDVNVNVKVNGSADAGSGVKLRMHEQQPSAVHAKLEKLEAMMQVPAADYEVDRKFPIPGSAQKNVNDHRAPDQYAKPSNAPIEDDVLAEKMFEDLNRQADLTHLESVARSMLATTPHALSPSLELKRHQVQALGWMINNERRQNEQKVQFPPGGILADSMGLGKTLSALALISLTSHNQVRVSNRVGGSQKPPAGEDWKGCPCKHRSGNDDKMVQCNECLRWCHVNCSAGEVNGRGFEDGRASVKCPRFVFVCLKCSEAASPEFSISAPFTSLVVVPTSVVFQWEAEILKHTPGLRHYIYYGPPAKKKFLDDPALFTEYDIIVTTYGHLHGECPSDGTDKKHPFRKAGPLYKVKFKRVVLDEAHMIRTKATRAFRSAKTLEAETYWCLTGTPVVNSISDIASYVEFICFNDKWDRLSTMLKTLLRQSATNFVQDDIKMQGVRELLNPIMLRRHKASTIDGEPILKLPTKVVMVKDDVVLEGKEQRMYQILDDRIASRFLKIVERGEFKKNMIVILVMLLRLRQYCDHPSMLPREMIKWLLEDDAKHFDDNGLRLMLPELAMKEPLSGKVDAGKAGRAGKVKPEKKQAIVYECSSSEEDGADDDDDDEDEEELAKMASAGYIRAIEASEKEKQKNKKLNGEDSDSEDDADDESGALAQEKRVLGFEDRKGGMEKVTNGDWTNYWPGPSTKSAAVLAEIQRFREEEEGVKILVFSLFPRFFDTLLPSMDNARINYLQVDGSLKVPERFQIIDKFRKQPKYSVLLLSTMCCSLGLNLTEATRCIIVDPWWNAAWEEQAIDRTHRMGQTREVQVTKFVIKGTVEERMHEMQKRKAEMAAIALGEGGRHERQKLTLEDFRMLFGVAGGRKATPIVPRYPGLGAPMMGGRVSTDALMHAMNMIQNELHGAGA